MTTEHDLAATSTLGRRSLLPLAVAGGAAVAALAPARPAIAAGGLPVPDHTLAELRALGPGSPDLVSLSEPGREGLFRADPTDTTTADDGGLTVVTIAGMRYKRTGVTAVNVKWFGAVGDGTTDDTSAINKAAIAAQRSARALYLPGGPAYRISSYLRLDSGMAAIKVYGDGYKNSVLRVADTVPTTAPITAVIGFSDDAGYNIGYEIADLGLDGNGRAKHGIFTRKLQHSLLTRLRINRTTIAGIAFGYGWCNDIVACEVSFNTGDGILSSAGQWNMVNIVDSKIYGNDGCGIRLVHETLKLRVAGCTIEGNRITGVYVRKGTFALDLTGCYFENNGSVGLTLTDPARVLKAAVVVNGAQNTETGEPVSLQYTSKVVSVTDSFCSVGSGEIFLAALGVTGSVNLRAVSIISAATTVPYTVVAAATSATGVGGRANGITIDNVSPASNRPLVWIAPLDLGAATDTDLHRAHVSAVPVGSAAPPLADFTSVLPGPSTATWTRVGRRYFDEDVFAIDASAASDVYGFTIDLADHVELRGALVHFTVSVRSTVAARVVLHNGVAGDSAAKDVSDAWRVVSTVAQLPTSGTATFGLRLDDAGTVEVTRPRLSLVGDRYV